MTAKPQSEPMQLLPHWVRAHTVTCNGCNGSYRIQEQSWFEPYRRQPFDSPGQPELNRLVVINPPYVLCPSCGKKNILMFPCRNHAGTVELHADETYRGLATGARVFVYALVGVESTRLQDLNKAVWQLKTDLEPHEDPTSWTIHMKVVSSGQRREKDPVLRLWDRSKCESLRAGICEILRQAHVVKSIAVVCHQNREQWAKETAFHMAILRNVDLLASIGRAAILRLDSQRPVKPGAEGRPVVHGWANSVVRRFREALLYQFVSHMLEIPDPIFIKPGSQPLAELADYLAFSSGRCIEQRSNGISFDYDIAEVGAIDWVGFVRDGRAQADRCVGIPSDSITERVW
jgi:hypothetical protein